MASSTETTLPFDEKKEPDHVDTKPAPTGPPLSPSKKRAKAASSAGLSELSKQLRILQAKNESQAVDINRLERQLRILAELQGISVADLRKALEDACANEAFGELQHRVAKLRAELEAASLAKRAEFAKDAAAPHIANLELRVGELEEVEEKHQNEIHHLYEQLRFEKERATRLEAERDQHKKDAQEYLDKLNKERARAARLESTFQEQMQKHMEEQAKKVQQLALEASKARKDADGAAAAAATNLQSVTPEMAADYERMVQALRQKDQEIRKLKAQLELEQDKWNKQLREEQEKIRQAQMDTKVDKDKMALTIKQLEDTDSQNELRLAQYKARFAVQDERIQDMGQQLNSLYTAFELLKEEMEAEDMKQAALKCNLDEADAEIARQMHNMEKKKSQRGGFSSTPDHDGYGRGSSRYGGASGSRKSGYESTRRSHNDQGDFANALGPANQQGGNGGAGEYYTPPYQQNSDFAAAAALASGSQRGGFASGRDIVDYDASSLTGAKSPSRVPRVITTPSTMDSYSTTGGYPSARAIDTTPVRGYSPRDFSSPTRNSPATPTTWQLLFPENRTTNTATQTNTGGVLISGLLIVKSKNSVVRKWKTKFSKLFLRGDHYQLDLGDSKSFALEFGISRVEFYPNHPLSFMIHVNPFDSTSPVIYAASTCEEDYNAWMQALTKATSGGEYEIPTAQPATRASLVAPDSPRAPARIESLQISASSNASQRSGSQQTGSSREEQEEADLQRALELSKQVV